MIKLCHVEDLPENGSKGFLLGSINLFVARQDGGVGIYRNSCPHLGIPLEWQADRFLDDEGQYIQCSTHGALFRIDTGLCVSGPCVHEYLEAIPFSIREGVIWLELDEEDTGSA